MTNQENQSVNDSNYKTRYLGAKTFRGGKCVYVSEKHHATIARLTNISGQQATISGFIHQVIEEHLREHKQEINDYYRALQEILL